MRKLKQKLSFILSLVMLCMSTLNSGFFIAAENITDFLGGEGTEESPYLISTKAHLNNIRNYPTAHFLMVADIKFAESDFAEGGEFYNEGLGWKPIPFVGDFDGRGHTITGLICHRRGSVARVYAGLFADNAGCIQNLGMIGGDVTASFSYAGGLVGYNHENGIIKNCYHTGSVSGSNYAGGIAGYDEGVISDCYNDGSVRSGVSSGSSYVGGIVGYSNGTIMNCYNTGDLIIECTPSYSSNVFTGSYMGGISGYKERMPVINCYNSGNLTIKTDQTRSYYDSGFVGGIVGYSDDSQIKGCNNTGEIIELSSDSYSYNSCIGGIAGYTSGVVYDCYNANTVSSSSCAGGIAGFTRGTINSCFNYGAVNCKSTLHSVLAGGITGDFEGTRGKIYDCYNMGEINATTRIYFSTTSRFVSVAGGIVGNLFVGEMYSCYNTGKISAKALHLSSVIVDIGEGGIAGKSDYGRMTGCYYLNVIEKGIGLLFGGNTKEVISCTDEQMRRQNTFTEFDFLGAWEMDESHFYPQLKEPIQSIQLLTSPDKTQSIQGLLPDLTGIKIKIIYADKTEIIAEATKYMLAEFDSNKTGIQTIHLTCGGQITAGTIDIEVIPKSITSIAVTTPPAKTTYVQGQPLNPAGGRMTVYYNNNTSEEVDLSEAQLFCADAQPGKATATAVYQGFEGSFGITVTERVLKSISLIEPAKLSYIEGQELNLTGGKLQIIFVSDDNYTEQLPLEPDMISGYVPEQLGIQKLTITYGEKTTTFVVNVVAKSLDSIAITTLPVKTEYLEGKDMLDLAGGRLTLTYNNGTSEEVDLILAAVSGFDNSNVGKQALTVTYQGKTTTLDVTVRAKALTEIGVTKQPAKRTYLEGDAFDPAGMEITAYYNNGTSEVVTDYAISGYDSTPGVKRITVVYGGKTATVEVTVRAKTLTEIRVTKQPAKRTYLEGDAFDSTGMEITAYYDNGTSEVVTDYGISGYDSTPGVKRLTVVYGGKTAALEVTVRGKALVSIAVTKNPDQMTYVEGTALDTTGMELTLVFDNGTKEVLATGWTETYDFSQPGRQEVRIDCRGKTTTLTVMVLSKALTGIAVSRLPNKLTYIEGNAFSAAGMEVTAYYDNNTSEIVTDRVTIQGYDSAPGIKTMAISYQGKEASFTVTVEAKKPVSIAWKAKPNKTVYFVGEELSLSGAVILIRYNNGTTAEQKLEGSWGADQYNPNQIGTQTIYIRYQETPPISFTVTVKSRVPSSITSGTYSVGGGFLSKVGAGTTAAQLLGGINEKDYCKVYKGNTEVTGNALVGTGMAVKLLDGGTVKQTAAVVVTGDTNGDGQITITDMLAVKAHVLKKSALAGAAAKAADTSGDKVISITDFIQIKAHILGKDKIQPRAC